jgi:hypothetical protein
MRGKKKERQDDGEKLSVTEVTKKEQGKPGRKMNNGDLIMILGSYDTSFPCGEVGEAKAQMFKISKRQSSLLHLLLKYEGLVVNRCTCSANSKI